MTIKECRRGHKICVEINHCITTGRSCPHWEKAPRAPKGRSIPTGEFHVSSADNRGRDKEGIQDEGHKGLHS